VILHRCFAWNPRARAANEDGPLWFPRAYQGEGRHDNPDDYGCLYVSADARSGVVEQLARFRGQRLVPAMLLRRGLRLALAAIELPDGERVIDLDEPAVLAANGLRPSQVATRTREVTQPYALDLYRRHADAAALGWWSTFESLWPNYTVFERSAEALRLADVRRLEPDDPPLVEAADLLGIAV